MSRVNFYALTSEETAAVVAEGMGELSGNDVIEIIKEWADHDETAIDDLAQLVGELEGAD